MSTNSFNLGQSLVKNSGWWEDFKAKKGIGGNQPKITKPEKKLEKKAEWSSWKSGVGPETAFISHEEYAKQSRQEKEADVNRFHTELKKALGQEKQSGIGSTVWEGAKFLPGVGAIPSWIDAGSAALKGNWGTALSEGAMGALSLVPGGIIARGMGAMGKGALRAGSLLGKGALAGGEALGKAGLKAAPGLASAGGRALGRMSGAGGMMGAVGKDLSGFAGRMGAKVPGGVTGAVQGAGAFGKTIPGMASQAGSAATSFAKGIPGRMTGGIERGINFAGKAMGGNTGNYLASNAGSMAKSTMGALPKLGLQMGVNNVSNTTRDNFYNSPGYKFNQPRYY